MKENFYIYIMTNVWNKILYTGVTNDIVRRVYEHKSGLVKGFTLKYNVKKLVYYEMFDSISMAISREKQIKSWKRTKKVELIETLNKKWEDLSGEIF